MTMALPPKLVNRLPSIIGKKQAAEQYGPIGIDIGSNGIRLVQFVNKGNRIELSASALVPAPDEIRTSAKQTRALLSKALRKQGFVGREVVTCLPPDDVKIMMISYLHQSGKQDEELIVQRIAERVDDDINNYVIDFMMVRPQVKDGQERSVLVAMAKRDKVIGFLDFMRKSGLAVKVLEIESTAIRRLVLVRHGFDHKANLMVVSMGRAQTYITVLSGRRLIYERDINFGEQQLIALLCKELELDEHEARTMLVGDETKLAADISEGEHNISVTDALYSVLKPQFMELLEDINRALVYAASETRGMPVEHVYLTNLVASWRGIEHFIDSLIEVPVSVLAPFAGLNNHKALEKDIDPRGAVVAGMALHGMSEAG
jgi:type IV pilus assembly protein PilM